MYSFSSNAWHCRFFEWCWGVKPAEHFKTMCPYFWQSVGTMVLLPFIALFKLLKVPTSNMSGFFKSCRKHWDDRKAAKLKKEEDAKKAKREAYLSRVKELYESFRKNPTGETANAMYRAYDKGEHYCYSWYYMISDLEDRELKDTLALEKLNEEYIQNQMKEEEERMDALKKHWVSKTFAAILAISFLIGGIYLLKLFIEYIPSLYYSVDWRMTGICVSAVFAFLFTMYIIIMSWSCIVDWWKFFWESVGDLFVWMFKPVKKKHVSYLIYPIAAVFMGIKISLDMIHATYKKYCPMIRWED